MAIYKPTFCSPLEGSFDLTATGGDLPVYIECQIDTSNTVINGYSIELYNEEGTRIFPASNPPDVPDGDVITSIKQWKTQFADDISIDFSGDGKNGSKLRFPFIVSQATGSTGSYQVANNQIEYPETTLPDNKTYFWKLTLYQMMENNDNNPPSTTPANKFYDMNLTTGTVLGSTNKRIQTVKSDKIGLDYYVQPVYIPSLSAGTGVGYNPTSWTHTGNITNVGTRALIKSYDSTHGHIYPVVGSEGIDENIIKYDTSGTDSHKANGVQIYKMSNNASDLNAYQKVAAAPNVTIPWEKWQDSIENPGDSYGIQEYYIHKLDHDDNNVDGTQYYYPFDVVKSANSVLEPVNSNYLMQAPISAAQEQTSNYTSGYMLSRPTDGAGLYVINPNDAQNAVGLALNTHTVGTTAYSIKWVADPITLGNVTVGGVVRNVWFSVFQYIDNSDDTNYHAAIIYITKSVTDTYAISIKNQLDIGSFKLKMAYCVDDHSVCLLSHNIRESNSVICKINANYTAFSSVFKVFACTSAEYTSGNWSIHNIIDKIIYDNTSQKYWLLINKPENSNKYFLSYILKTTWDAATSGSIVYCENNEAIFFDDLALCGDLLKPLSLRLKGNTLHLLSHTFSRDDNDHNVIVKGKIGSDGCINQIDAKVIFDSSFSDNKIITASDDLQYLYLQNNNGWFIYQISANDIQLITSSNDTNVSLISMGYLYTRGVFYWITYNSTTKNSNVYMLSKINQLVNLFEFSNSTVSVGQWYNAIADDYYGSGNNIKRYLCLTIDDVLYKIIMGANSVSSSSNPVWFEGNQHTIGISSGSSPRIVLNGQKYNNNTPVNSTYIKNSIQFNQSPTFSNLGNPNPPRFSSRYNGIYYPTFSTETMLGGIIKVSVRWTRVPDANTWGEISTKIVMVTTSGDDNKLELKDQDNYSFKNQNIQIFRDTGGPTTGTINQTPFYFVLEKPIDLYEYDTAALQSNPDINNTGLIFYNHVDGTGQNAVGTLYVRPFIGIHGGQKYIDKKTSTNTFDITHVDDYSSGHYGTWFVNYAANSVAWVDTLKPDEDKYKINTYFTTSDEYNFRLEKKSTLSDYTVTNTPNSHPMQYDFSAAYNFATDNYVSWNSFQWQLYSDANYTQPIDIQEVKHNMGIKCSFYGLIPGTTYYPKCVVTTNSGRILESTVSGGHAPGSQGTSSPTAKWYSNDQRTDIKYEILCDDGAVRIYLPTHTSYNTKTCHILKREVWQEPNSQTWSGEPVYKPVKLNIASGGQRYVDDYNVGNHRIYEYIVYLSDGTNTSTYKTIRIEPRWMGCVIMSLKPDTKSELGTYTSINGDSNNIWHFRYNLEQGSETLNMAHNVQTTLSQYPSFSYGPTQYLTGNFSCLIGDGFKVGETVHDPIGARANTGYYENLAPRNHTMSNWAVNRLSEWRKFCASSTPKLLKDDKGQIMLVQISSASNQVNLHWNKMPETINFDWTEIGDATKLISHD